MTLKPRVDPTPVKKVETTEWEYYDEEDNESEELVPKPTPYKSSATPV